MQHVSWSDIGNINWLFLGHCFKSKVYRFTTGLVTLALFQGHMFVSDRIN